MIHGVWQVCLDTLLSDTLFNHLIPSILHRIFALASVYVGGVIFSYLPYLRVIEKDAADQSGEYFCFLFCLETPITEDGLEALVCCHSGLLC